MSTDTAHGLLGNSPLLAEVRRLVSAVAVTDSTVLVHGETGTGKERVARALHESSRRKHGPFVKVNCAAIPSGLYESELLGHEKGAFTGALARRIGRFEAAHQGTVFLDEIGELPVDIQPKLLRLLQEREFERVGGMHTVRSDVRIIAATNRDLLSMVRARTFREDLYYRLGVFPIQLPPLRARSEDIPQLANHFVREIARRIGKPVVELSPGALARLTAHHWPGNIRELQNVLERAVILSEGGVVDLPPLERGPFAAGDTFAARSFDSRPLGAPPPAGPAPGALADVDRAHILRVLEQTNWVIAGPNGAAERLEMKRTTLNSRMKKLGIVRRQGLLLERSFRGSTH